MDVKLNKALEERYLQIVANQKQKQMREERKKAALTSKDSTTWFQHEMQSWMLQNHLQNRVYSSSGVTSPAAASQEHHQMSRQQSCPSPTAGNSSALNSSGGSNSTKESADSANTSGGKDQIDTSTEWKSTNSDAENVLERNVSLKKESGQSKSPGIRGDDSVVSAKGDDDDEINDNSIVIKKENSESQSDVNGNITTLSSQTENNNNNTGVNNEISPLASQSRHDFTEKVHDEEQDHFQDHNPVTDDNKITREFSPTAKTSSAGELNLNRIRNMMFTPEPNPPENLPGFDDNCNLKENLDRLIMKAFSKLGIENCNVDVSPTDGNGQDGSQSHNTSQGTSANSSISISPDSQTGRRQNDGSGTSREGSGGFNVEYPSVFPGLKHQMNIRNETVIVTRLDGVNVSTGHKVSLYKCYLCGRIFHQLSLLQCHLSTHFDKYMTFYECLYCDAHFKFKTQLLQHMNSTHNVNYALSDIPDTPSITAMVTVSDDVSASTEFPTGPTDTQTPASQEDSSSSQGHNPADLAEFEGQAAGVGSIFSEDNLLPSSSTPVISHKGKYHSGITLKKVNGVYVCRFCNKTFERSFSVIRHERMHTGYKPCICRHCGRGFSEPRNLRQHMKRFHNNNHQLLHHHTLGKSGKPKRRSSSNVDERELLANKRTSPLLQESYVFSSQGNRDDLSTAPPGSHGGGEDLLIDKETGFPSSRLDSEDRVTESPENESEMSEVSSSKLDSSNEIANEIREKERLGDDVTVVIPSDAPLDSRERYVDTPRSINSENTTWSNISEVEGDTAGMLSVYIFCL